MFALYSCIRARSLPGTRTETHLRVVRFVLLLCAHVLTIACVNEELKCKLLIVPSLTWVHYKCVGTVEMSKILLLPSFPPSLSRCRSEAAFRRWLPSLLLLTAN